MGVHDCMHGPGAYKLGLVMGQRVDIMAIYQRHRYHHVFSGPTAARSCSCSCSGKVLTTKSKRKPGAGPVAKLSSLMSSVVEEMTSSPSSSQSSVTSLDDVVAPGDDDSDSTDYVFRIVYMSRPDYVGEL